MGSFMFQEIPCSLLMNCYIHEFDALAHRQTCYETYHLTKTVFIYRGPADMAHTNISFLMTPEEALQKLLDGNKRFMQGFDAPDSFKYQDASIRKTQHPYACILGCADSRVSPEHTFDESHGNLFVTRVAGNFVTPEIIASLEYGTSVLGASIILVLGHSGCGAVHATIDAVSANVTFDGHIGQIIQSIEPAVAASRHANLDTWMENAVAENVQHNVQHLRQSEPILAGLIRSGKLKVVGGIYNLETGEVNILADR